MSVSSSVKTSLLFTALLIECNSTEMKENWTENKKANDAKSLHIHEAECVVLFLTLFFRTPW